MTTRMFDALLKFFRRSPAGHPDEGIRSLDHHAPRRDASQESTPQATTVLCREALLGRDQRIAGYRFLLRESLRNRIRHSSRAVHHVYAEVLIGNLLQTDVLRLLGHRLAVIEVPDSFLAHDSLRRFPPANTVFSLLRVSRDDDASVLAAIRELKTAGYRIGIHAAAPEDIPPALRPLLDLIVIDSLRGDPGDIRRLVDRMGGLARNAAIAAINLETIEEFGYLHSLGATYFHGPFVTRREAWTTSDLSPDVLQARPLLDAIRCDAAHEEIVELVKRNPAIALRLLRYVNSAALGQEREVESIERAVHIVGRQQLLRWVMMVLFSRHPDTGRSHAALETAMVRGRMLEHLAAHNGRDAETLFLVGLLSLVDVVFRVDMRRALDALGVAQEVRAAVTDDVGPDAAMLALAIAWERGDAAAIEIRGAECGISAESAAEAYMQALWWALDVRP